MRFVEPLTGREIECLYHASQGKSIRETAETLCISQETVKTHRLTILQKLACKSMTSALVKAIEQGFLLI